MEAYGRDLAAPAGVSGRTEAGRLFRAALAGGAVEAVVDALVHLALAARVAGAALALRHAQLVHRAVALIHKKKRKEKAVSPVLVSFLDSHSGSRRGFVGATSRKSRKSSRKSSDK